MGKTFFHFNETIIIPALLRIPDSAGSKWIIGDPGPGWYKEIGRKRIPG
jgi:hypothetical protein